MTARAFLEGLFNTAVAAAHPANCLPAHLPAPPAAGRLVILAAGKAAGAMAEVAERHYLDGCGLPASRIGGLAVTRRGYARPTRHLRVIEAGHPIPDAAGLAATLATLALADAAGPDDLVLALISGGASANWIAPAAGLTPHARQIKKCYHNRAIACRYRRLDNGAHETSFEAKAFEDSLAGVGGCRGVFGDGGRRIGGGCADSEGAVAARTASRH